MPSVEDLGRKIKRENPGAYDDYSDYEVGEIMKEEYPEKYPEYSNVSKENPKTSLAAYTEHLPVPNQVLETPPERKEIVELKEYYSPRKGRFTSWWQRGKAESRVQLLQVLNEEQTLVIEKGAMLEREIRNQKKDEASFVVFIAQNAHTLITLKHSANLIEDAINLGLSTQKADDYKYEKLIRELNVIEHREMSKIDLDNKVLEMQEQVRLAIIAKHLSELQKISLIQGQIDLVYEQIDKIRREKLFSKEIEEMMIEDRMDIANSFKEIRRAKQAGLLEAHNGGVVRGHDEDAEL